MQYYLFMYGNRVLVVYSSFWLPMERLNTESHICLGLEVTVFNLVITVLVFILPSRSVVSQDQDSSRHLTTDEMHRSRLTVITGWLTQYRLLARQGWNSSPSIKLTSVPAVSSGQSRDTTFIVLVLGQTVFVVVPAVFVFVLKATVLVSTM